MSTLALTKSDHAGVISALIKSTLCQGADNNQDNNDKQVNVYEFLTQTNHFAIRRCCKQQRGLNWITK